jgi:hypothetical protein
MTKRTSVSVSGIPMCQMISRQYRDRTRRTKFLMNLRTTSAFNVRPQLSPGNPPHAIPGAPGVGGGSMDPTRYQQANLRDQSEEERTIIKKRKKEKIMVILRIFRASDSESATSSSLALIPRKACSTPTTDLCIRAIPSAGAECCAPRIVRSAESS